ncbi:thiamine pyrophosphate-binding protein [Marinimicrococcus flavescens]|uniref:Thiamine pyrophosphate-binding protein n=1 Tax=Marinimicrococcus flavescens TaxID=3031815 RepID=A0AAP3UX59_9PROT|nr:thiamine pyrophosphate-binding protein [Marinimicrococcus flavescens]
MGDRIDGARYMAETLHRQGVSHVFFIDAIMRRTLVELEALGIERVLAHSEKSAVYMADGYARVTGRPGVCMAQSVGAANLAAGLQDAYLHRTPLIAMTGRKPPMFRHRNAYQELDHAPLYASVTKYHAEVETAEQLPFLLPQAFREATEGTPRPVHLDLAGLQAEIIETGTVEQDPLEPHHTQLPARRSPPSGSEIEAAAAALARARQPVIVAGGGAMVSRAQDAVRRFAEALQIPVATSTGGRGILPTDHELHVGCVGLYSAPHANRILHEADLVIFLGCHTGDQVTCNWTIPGQATPIVQIDVDGSEIGRNYPAAVGVLGDPALAMEALLAACGGQEPRAAWAGEVRARVAAWRESMAEAMASEASPIRVERLCHEITKALPENGVLVADTGYSTIWAATLIDLPHPGQTFLRAAGSLGWSFPAALGAKCGAPERPVVCFTGDGAFYYHLSELETARRRNIPLVTVVNNNSAFGQGLVNIRNIYGGRPGNQDEIIRFGPTDFAAVARSFGVEGIRVEDPSEIAGALSHALSLGRPAVIDVVTDAEPRAPEPWTL